MIVSAIVASSINGAIGLNGEMPWHLPEDLKFFKKKTQGKYVIMGRKTFESILKTTGKPLPNRFNVVISSDKNYLNDWDFRNFSREESRVMTFTSIEEALDKLKAFEVASSLSASTLFKEKEVFVIGGESIFKQFFEKGVINNIYHTVIHKEFEGDRFFSVPQGYERLTVQAKTRSEKADLDYSILKWFKDTSEIQGWVDDDDYKEFPNKHIVYQVARKPAHNPPKKMQ